MPLNKKNQTKPNCHLLFIAIIYDLKKNSTNGETKNELSVGIDHMNDHERARHIPQISRAGVLPPNTTYCHTPVALILCKGDIYRVLSLADRMARYSNSFKCCDSRVNTMGGITFEALLVFCEFNKLIDL